MLNPEGNPDGADRSSSRKRKKRGKILYSSRKELHRSRKRGANVILHSEPSGCFAEAEAEGDLIGGIMLKEEVNENELLKPYTLIATSLISVRKFRQNCPSQCNFQFNSWTSKSEYRKTCTCKCHIFKV